MRGTHSLWKLQTSASKILPSSKNHFMPHRTENRATGKRGELRTLGTAIKETRGKLVAFKQLMCTETGRLTNERAVNVMEKIMDE